MKTYYAHPKLLVHIISGNSTSFKGCFPFYNHLESNSIASTEKSSVVFPEEERNSIDIPE